MAKRCPCFWQHQPNCRDFSRIVRWKEQKKISHQIEKIFGRVRHTFLRARASTMCGESLYTTRTVHENGRIILLFLWFIHSDTFYVLGVLNFSVNHKNSDCIILLKKCRTASHRTYGFTRNKWRGTTHVLLLDDKTKKYDSMRHHFPPLESWHSISMKNKHLRLNAHEKIQQLTQHYGRLWINLWKLLSDFFFDIK